MSVSARITPQVGDTFRCFTDTRDKQTVEVVLDPNCIVKAKLDGEVLEFEDGSRVQVSVTRRDYGTTNKTMMRVERLIG